MTSPVVQATSPSTEVTQYSYGTGARTYFNRGVVKRGSVAAPGRNVDRVLNSASISRAGNQAFGSTVIPDTASQGATKALDFATFQYQAKRNFVIRRVSKTLAGAANTTLWSGGSNAGLYRSIHKTEVYRSTFLSALSWALDSNGNVDYTSTLSTRNTTFYSQVDGAVVSTEQDNAANPSLTVPGELVYKLSQSIPVQSDYHVKQDST